MVWFWAIIFILTVVYVVFELYFDYNKLTDIITTIIAIFTASTFLLEYRENRKLNEAQFIVELNEQFIANEQISAIEWELEKFYIGYLEKDKISEKYINEFESKFDIDNKQRQYLVNYLVHLEGIAALVKNKVLRIEAINDLMSYRYFLAMNNPVVQKLELSVYSDYYKGCFEIYNDWVKELNKQHIKIPMYEKFPLRNE